MMFCTKPGCHVRAADQVVRVPGCRVRAADEAVRSACCSAPSPAAVYALLPQAVLLAWCSVGRRMSSFMYVSLTSSLRNQQPHTHACIVTTT